MIFKTWDFLIANRDYIFDILATVFGAICWCYYRLKNPAMKEIFSLAVSVYNWIEKSHKGKQKKADEFKKEMLQRFELRYGKKLSGKVLNKVVDEIEDMIYVENVEKKIAKVTNGN